MLFPLGEARLKGRIPWWFSKSVKNCDVFIKPKQSEASQGGTQFPSTWRHSALCQALRVGPCTTSTRRAELCWWRYKPTVVAWYRQHPQGKDLLASFGPRRVQYSISKLVQALDTGKYATHSKKYVACCSLSLPQLPTVLPPTPTPHALKFSPPVNTKDSVPEATTSSCHAVLYFRVLFSYCNITNITTQFSSLGE